MMITFKKCCNSATVATSETSRMQNPCRLTRPCSLSRVETWPFPLCSPQHTPTSYSRGEDEESVGSVSTGGWGGSRFIVMIWHTTLESWRGMPGQKNACKLFNRSSSTIFASFDENNHGCKSTMYSFTESGYEWAPRTHDLCVLDSNVRKALKNIYVFVKERERGMVRTPYACGSSLA